ncbi:hypothetical protein GCM10008959_32750 [Deinococcus seoulensis]|uniref:Uncharacterized protein n=1 Tax=Deinococcus seoulensis TaxID=1837379 RepID=A0ABQ2RYV6_9DEIO|nr:hypothetical protein [Deinococcus seoulensis]GGR68126.1 hypothetical protein GCM10008959_32750 [Deinococcus seoulensis]
MKKELVERDILRMYLGNDGNSALDRLESKGYEIRMIMYSSRQSTEELGLVLVNSHPTKNHLSNLCVAFGLLKEDAEWMMKSEYDYVSLVESIESASTPC